MRNGSAFRRFPLLAIACLSLLFWACSSSDNNGNNKDGGPDGGVDGVDAGDDNTTTTRTIVFSMPELIDEEEAGLQLDVAPTPDDHFAVAYWKQGTAMGECETPILGGPPTPVLEDMVRYAWHDGTAWHWEEVTTQETTMLNGISLGFDNTTPTIAYLGGLEGSQVCGGTDLMIATRTGADAWTLTPAVEDSNEAVAGADCPKMQAICDFGDVVGLWPSLAVAPDGTIGVAYRDVHNGYTKDAQDCSDLEWTFSSGGAFAHEWIDLGGGSGLFNSLAFDSQSQPAVAYHNANLNVIAFAKRFDGVFVGSPLCETAADCPVEGMACVKIQADGRCLSLIHKPEQELPTESLSLTVAPDGRYLVAYFDPDQKNLMLAHSTDGLTWTKGILDSDGSTGMSPSIVIEPGSGLPAVAYYRCEDYHPNELECNQNNDGVRFAFFAGTYPDELTTQVKWKKIKVSDDRDAFDGRHVAAAVLPDGTVGIGYSYVWIDPSTSKSHINLMFKRGTWEEQ